MQAFDTTHRAEEIRETTGMAWEYACLKAERERDAAGPRWEYRNPQGVVFTAFDGVDIAILRASASL